MHRRDAEDAKNEYKGLKLECGYRLDLLVADTIVLEVKAVDAIIPIHEAQLLTYMKLGGWKVGAYQKYFDIFSKKRSADPLWSAFGGG